MDLSTGRLEGLARIEDRPFSKSSEPNKQRAPRRAKNELASDTEPADEQETHQLDDLA